MCYFVITLLYLVQIHPIFVLSVADLLLAVVWTVGASFWARDIEDRKWCLLVSLLTVVSIYCHNGDFYSMLCNSHSKYYGSLYKYYHNQDNCVMSGLSFTSKVASRQSACDVLHTMKKMFSGGCEQTLETP